MTYLLGKRKGRKRERRKWKKGKKRKEGREKERETERLYPLGRMDLGQENRLPGPRSPTLAC